MQNISSDASSNRYEWDGKVFVRAASVVELEQRPFKVVTLEDRHILLLRAECALLHTECAEIAAGRSTQ